MSESNSAWLARKREANDKQRRAIAFADEANRLLRECDGSAIRFDSDGNSYLVANEEVYDYCYARSIRGVPSDSNRQGSRFKRATPRTRVVGVAPGSTEPTASLRVIYADGTSEVRSHRDFRANPARTTPVAATRTESETVGGSQADYD